MNEGTVGQMGYLETARAALKKMKGLGIVASILMVILGILLLVHPGPVASIFIWLFVVGILVHGVEKIVFYCKMPKGVRDGYQLAAGILLVLAASLLIISGISNILVTTLELNAMIAVMIGFICLFGGISRICGSGAVAASGGSKGMAIFSGILEIICGILVLSAPLMGLLAVTVVFGCYLLIMGIALFINWIAV